MQVKKNVKKLVVLITFLIAGFFGHYISNRSTPLNSQDEAASVMVSVSNVVPWFQIADAMRPDFELGGDEALKKVVPTTLRIQQESLSDFGIKLGIDQKALASSNSGAATADSAASDTASADNAASSASRTESGTSKELNTLANIGVSPVLQYQAALALFESVEMMNHEVQNATRLQGYSPYLVRLKLAVMPYRTSLPYSLHTRISFFPSYCSNENNGWPPKETCLAEDSGAYISNNAKTPVVIPLLATDDIERALESQASEAAKQWALALAENSPNIAGKLELREEIGGSKTSSGQNFNNRLTVTRQSDNTLYVRIGAANNSGGEYSLVNQNYNIAVLLLIPESYLVLKKAHFADAIPTDACCNSEKLPEINGPHSLQSPPNVDIDIITHTTFRSEKDGSILKEPSENHFVQQIDNIIIDVLSKQGYDQALNVWKNLNNKDKVYVRRKLINLIQESNYHNYKAFFDSTNPDSTNPICKPGDSSCKWPRALNLSKLEYLKSFWTRLSALIADLPVQSTFLEIPRPVRISIRAPKQAAILVEEKKKTATVQLHDVAGTAFNTLTASLNITFSKKEYSLPARSINLDPSTRILTLDFPSLADMNLDKPDKITVSVSQLAWIKACEERKVGMSPLCDQLTNQELKNPMTFMVLASKPLSASQDTTASSVK